MSKASYIQYPTDQVFLASNQATQAMSTALSTTQTGFTLYNPAGSGTTLVIQQVTVAVSSAPAGIATIVYAANVNPLQAAPATNTVLTTRCAKLGNTTAGVGIAYSATTLAAAPVVVRSIGGPVATGSVSSPYIMDDVQGSLAVQPGCYVSINSLTTAISAIVSMVWTEVPQL